MFSPKAPLPQSPGVFFESVEIRARSLGEAQVHRMTGLPATPSALAGLAIALTTRSANQAHRLSAGGAVCERGLRRPIWRA